MLKLHPYNRQSAVEYAVKFAINPNRKFFDYTNSGGNCANYVSQCVLAGAPQMNLGANGWFYFSPANTSISWANVEPFFNFATTNLKEGFFANSTKNFELLDIGDVVQLKFANKSVFSHSLIVTKIINRSPSGILVCANSRNVLNVPISSYVFKEYRILHILGYRTKE